MPFRTTAICSLCFTLLFCLLSVERLSRWVFFPHALSSFPYSAYFFCSNYIISTTYEANESEGKCSWDHRGCVRLDVEVKLPVASTEIVALRESCPLKVGMWGTGDSTLWRYLSPPMDFRESQLRQLVLTRHLSFRSNELTLPWYCKSFTD